MTFKRLPCLMGSPGRTSPPKHDWDAFAGAIA